MSNVNDLILTERANLVAIADAVRSKIGKSEGMNLGQIINNIYAIEQTPTINLDAELTEQDTQLSSQDNLIASIASALQGKAAGGGSVEIPDQYMTTTTINYDIAGSVDLSYLGLNENGILVVKSERLSGVGSIDITSSGRSLIDGYATSQSLFSEPTVNITHQSTDSIDYQEALIHHGILSGDGGWFFMLPGGIFNLVTT